MNTLNGYSKSTLTDNNVLTASGGHIPLELLHITPYRSSFELYDTLPMLLSGKLLGNNCLIVNAGENTAPHSKVYKIVRSCSFSSPETMNFTPGETICIESWIMRPSGATGTAGTYYLGIKFRDKLGKPINGNDGCVYFGESSAWTCPCDGVWHRRYNEYTIPTTHTAYNGSDGGGFFSGTVRCLVNHSAGTIPTYYGGFRIYKKNININANSATTANNALALDGTSKGGLFTNLSNSSNKLSVTIGGTNKTLTVDFANLSLHVKEYSSISSSTYTTVKAVKDRLVELFTNFSYGVGSNVIVPYQTISKWSDESFTLTTGGNFAVIKIGGYSGTNHGQWLLSSYGTNKLGYVGRHNSEWSKIYWVATTDDIPTSLKNPNKLTLQAGTFSATSYDGSTAVTVNIPNKTSHLSNDSGFLTSLPSHNHSNIISLGNKSASDLSSTYGSGLTVAGIYNDGWPFTFGSAITANGNGGYFQIAGLWSGSITSDTNNDFPTEMYLRNRRDSYDIWSTWTRVLTDRNYTSYVNTTNFPGLNRVGDITEVTAGAGLDGGGTSGSVTLTNAGVRSTTINGNYLRVNTNGTNTDLTIPYATNADTVDNKHASDFIQTSVQMISGKGGKLTGYHQENGWHRIATIDVSSSYGYGSHILYLTGTYNYAQNTNAIIHINTMHNIGKITQVSGYVGFANKIRLVNVSSNKFYVDIHINYTDNPSSSSDSPGAVYYYFLGNGSVTINTLVEKITDTVTVASEVTLVNSEGNVLTSGNYTSWINTTNFPGLNKVGTVTSVTVTGANGLSGSGTVTSSGTITLSNSGVRSTTINGNYLRVNTNGTNADLTIPYATNAKALASYYSSRPTSIAPEVTGDGSMFHFLCTSAVTDTTTDPGDAHILHFNWDNKGGYDFQIAGLTGKSTMKIRGMNGGTWKPWATVLSSENYTSYIHLYKKTIDASYKTAFRTQTKGNTTNGYYISAIRCNTASVDAAPLHGSGIAFGSEDTHGYLYMNYSTADAYIGGGNVDKLNWTATLLHSGNSSVSKSGQTLTVKINGVEQSLTNTTYSSLKNPNAIKFKKTDGTTVTYDGSSAADLTDGVNYATESVTLKRSTGTNVNSCYEDLKLKYYTLSGCDSSVSTDGKRYAGTDNSYGFPVSNNANGMLWLGSHTSGPYGHQLGFSSDGRIYDRYISAGSFPTTVNGGSWNKVAWTTDITKSQVGLGNVQNTAFYQRTVTVNGTVWYMAGTNNSAAFTIYAPSTAGSSGLVLTSTAGTPGWTDQDSLSVGYATSAGSASNITVSNSDDNKTLKLVFHDGNALKSTGGIYCNPSTDTLYSTKVIATNFTSNVATGTQPYACTSTTLNTNLNADMLDGLHAGDFAPIAESIPLIVGTQTSTTGVWTGNSSLSELVDGQTIKYWLPQSGSGNATLALILEDGSTTGEIPCYYSGSSRLTTHFSKNNLILLTYRENVVIDSTTTIQKGWWAHSQYNSDNYYTQMIAYTSVTAGVNGIKQKSLIMEDNTGKRQSLTTSSGTGTSKSKNTAGFKLGEKIYYYSGSSDLSSGSNVAEWTVYSANIIDFRYSSNCNLTLDGRKMVYLVGTITNGLFYLDDTIYTQTPNDSTKVYIPIGYARVNTASTNKGYLVDFDNTYNPVVYDGTTLVPYSIIASKLGSSTLGNATKPIYLNNGVATACSTYAGGTAVTLNGTSKAATTASFYAPTSAGTNNYVLKSNGSGAPSWVELNTLKTKWERSEDWNALLSLDAWCKVLCIKNYSSILFSIILNQNSQACSHTYMISVGWNSAKIIQLGYNGYSGNCDIPIRLVKISGSLYDVEIKLNHLATGLTSPLSVPCRYICYSPGTVLSTYTTHTINNNETPDVIDSLISSYNIAKNLVSDKLGISDLREEARNPNDTNFPLMSIAGWFNNKGTPNTSWHTGITVRSYDNNYSSWQLCSYASTGTDNDNYRLYHRSGNNNTWKDWKPLAYLLEVNNILNLMELGSESHPIILMSGTFGDMDVNSRNWTFNGAINSKIQKVSQVGPLLLKLIYAHVHPDGTLYYPLNTDNYNINITSILITPHTFPASTDWKKRINVSNTTDYGSNVIKGWTKLNYLENSVLQSVFILGEFTTVDYNATIYDDPGPAICMRIFKLKNITKSSETYSILQSSSEGWGFVEENGRFTTFCAPAVEKFYITVIGYLTNK